MFVFSKIEEQEGRTVSVWKWGAGRGRGQGMGVGFRKER
jgi:hypothetical protein